jgi:hypothetical protein
MSVDASSLRIALRDAGGEFILLLEVVRRNPL